MSATRKSYPSDVMDGEWEFLLPEVCLMRADAPQRESPLRERFDALRYVVKTGGQWRFLPHDVPPWTAVYQQARRWVQAGVFETITHDLRVIVRVLEGRNGHHPRFPHAAIDTGKRSPRWVRRHPEKRARRSMQPSIRWEICWRWPSPRRTNRTGHKWQRWPHRFRR